MPLAEVPSVDMFPRSLAEVQAAVDAIHRNLGDRSDAGALVAALSTGPDATIHQAVEQLTKTQRRILVVRDDAGRLLGTVTDYDIRRSILAGSPLGSPVSAIMSTNPVVLSSSKTESEIEAFLRNNRAHYVPVVDAANRVVDIRFQQELLRSQAPAERIAVVMAGGFGRRLRPFTEDVPKPMLCVGGRPILFMILDQIIAEGFTKVYVSIHYKSDVIVQAVNGFAHYREIVTFVNECEPLGTAGGLSLLPQRPKGSFLVINGDLVTQVPLRELLRYHERDKNFITVATKVEHYTVPYGVIEVEDARVVGIREKPKFEYIVNIGAYMLEPAVLDDIAQDERLDMPELIWRALKHGKIVGRFPVHEYWLDVGTPEQYARANHDATALQIARSG